MSNVDNEARQIGRISDKTGPSLRQTRKGTYVSNFTIAVDRHYTNTDGSTTADYHQCTAFGKLASNIHKYESKGDLVAVSGELRNHTSPYTVQIGNQSRTIHITNEVIVVDSIRFFRSAKDYKNNNGQQNGSNQPINNAPQGNNQPVGNNAPQNGSNNPFGNQSTGNNAPVGNNQPVGNNGGTTTNPSGGFNTDSLSKKVDQASGNAPVGNNAPQSGSNTPFGNQSNGNNAPVSGQANGNNTPANGPQGNPNPKGGKNPKDFPF